MGLSLFACAQIGAARHEEADEQLETLLAQPVSRQLAPASIIRVGLVPTQPFRPAAAAAAVMVGIGLLAALAALDLFRRRDLLGA